MRLSIPSLLVQATLLHRGLSTVVKGFNEVPKVAPRDQIILNMGSSWSSPTSKAGENIIPHADSIAADPAEHPRYRRFTQLLKLNHHDHSLFYHHLIYHNHLPHILGSAYAFGASTQQLNDVYEQESKELEQWEDSPEEIDPDNWRAHLGDKKYQRAYLSFFEDELAHRNNDWKATVWHFLTDKQIDDPDQDWDDHQLLYGLYEGLGHPLIHLGYALELEDKNVATEALAMAAASYNQVHKFSDNPYPPTPFINTDNIRTILDNIFGNPEYDEFCATYGAGNPDKVLENVPDQLYMDFYSYVIQKQGDKLREVFQRHVEASVMLFTAGHKIGDPQYDFFLVHTVTSAQALRVILPHLNIQQTWHHLIGHMVLMVQVYISQCRPTIKDWLVEDYEVGDKGWEWVRKQALESKWKFDAHYVKVLRSFEEFEKLFGAGNALNKDGTANKKHNIYLKAAVKFASEFSGWTGWGSASKLDVKKAGESKI